jgi:hypothetical protein
MPPKRTALQQPEGKEGEFSCGELGEARKPNVSENLKLVVKDMCAARSATNAAQH